MNTTTSTAATKTKTRPNVMTLMMNTPGVRPATGTAPALSATALEQVDTFLRCTAKRGKHIADLHDSCRAMYDELYDIEQEMIWRRRYDSKNARVESDDELKDLAKYLFARLESELDEFKRMVKDLDTFNQSFAD